jgi:hypothetical protein
MIRKSAQRLSDRIMRKKNDAWQARQDEVRPVFGTPE